MARHGQIPARALNKYLRLLQQAPTADKTIAAIVTFEEYWHWIVKPAPVKNIAPISHYRASGLTRLYQTVGDITQLGLGLKYQAAQRGQSLRLVIGVLTDGLNESGPDFDEAEDLAHVQLMAAEAYKQGVIYEIFGLGLDALYIAKKMGLVGARCHNLRGTPGDIEESTIQFAKTTILTSQGYNPFAQAERSDGGTYRGVIVDNSDAATDELPWYDV